LSLRITPLGLVALNKATHRIGNCQRKIKPMYKTLETQAVTDIFERDGTIENSGKLSIIFYLIF